MVAFVRRKAFLLCKNPCGAGFDGGRGSSSQRTQPPRKEISRGNLLCAESGLTNLSYPSIIERSKVREHAQLVQPSAPGSSGVPEGPLPLCFRKSPEKNLLKGFLWATSSRRLDTALLCAAKKCGVELNQLAGFCQFKLALAATAGSNDYSSSCSGSTRSIEITRLPSSTRIKITPCVSRL